MKYRDELYVDAFQTHPNNVTKNRTINHCDCEHILFHNETCTKKIFNCYDLINDEFIDIEVCNEWFKLKLKEYLLKSDKNYFNLIDESHDINTNNVFYKKFTSISSFVKSEIIDKYIDTNIGRRSVMDNSMINYTLAIRLCYRPSLLYPTSLKDGIMILLDLGMNQRRNLVLEDAISRTLRIFLMQNKYSKYSKIERQLNKLQCTSDKQSNEFIIEFNDLLINILNTK